ncbi:MAG: Rid family hydrolase [Pseudomonadota bacterium]
MTTQTFRSGGRLEGIGSYSRAKRVGPFVYVAGTTAIEPTGKLHAPGDAFAQSVYILGRIEEALQAVGAEMRHVVRTRAYLTSLSEHGSGFIRAHGTAFEGIDPVTCGIECGLNQPGMVVEIEADAVIHDDRGAIRWDL